MTYYVSIVEGRNTFFAFRTLSWRWQQSPNLTENTKVKFALEGKSLILIGDDGKQFKMSLGKKRQNTPTEQLEECRNSVIDMHAEFVTSEALEDGLRKLSGQDLYSTFVSNLECSNLCIQFQDWGLLTQFEAARIAMLGARTSQTNDSTAPASEQDCDETIASVNSNPAISLTADQLSERARILHHCAMTDYQKGGDRWFLRTDEARQRILTEIVARQANAGIGEHYVGDQVGKGK